MIKKVREKKLKPRDRFCRREQRKKSAKHLFETKNNNKNKERCVYVKQRDFFPL